MVNMDFCIGHEGVRPHPSQDLFQMYGLSPIAAGVARTLPNGQKNVIRKTYKGYMKNLGLSGQFDAVKKDLEDPDTLFAMTVMPDEEWDVHNRRGREIEKGMTELASNSLGRAMTMARGAVPKELWNNSVLGELATQEHVGVTKSITPKASAAPTPAPREPINANSEALRPKRNVKKRTYGDSSFEGYGEGFVDDDLQEGYSTGDGDERGPGHKKRKKVCTLNLWKIFSADKRRLRLHITSKALLYATTVMAPAWLEYDDIWRTALCRLT